MASPAASTQRTCSTHEGWHLQSSWVISNSKRLAVGRMEQTHRTCEASWHTCTPECTHSCSLSTSSWSSRMQAWKVLMPTLDERLAIRLQLPNFGRDLSDDQRVHSPTLCQKLRGGTLAADWPAGTVKQPSGSYRTLLTAIRRQARRRWLRRARTCPSCSSASVARSICTVSTQ